MESGYSFTCSLQSLGSSIISSRTTRRVPEHYLGSRSVCCSKITFCNISHLPISAFARTAALILHVDAVFILLPVCRNFISLLRRTPLNDIIPFDKNITFHKATAWSIVTWSAVHILAHMVNFGKLAKADPDANTTGKVIVAFLGANFLTGPGITGWIMTAALGIMVFFAIEKRRRAHFEWFWYSHHLFIVFFINWQLHGMFCMIKPDRPPYCSSNTIGVFWVSLYVLIPQHMLIRFPALLAGRWSYLDLGAHPS